MNDLSLPTTRSRLRARARVLGLAAAAAAVAGAPVASVPALADTGSPRPAAFASFEANPHDAPHRQYRFAAAGATSRSPVIITAVGRGLNASDRGRRLELQKLWLQANVPDDYEFRIRFPLECRFVGRKGEAASCEVWEFAARDGRLEDYFFYLGNWH